MNVLDDVDALYESAVRSPEAVTDVALADWATTIAQSRVMDRHTAKLVRRCLYAAKKLVRAASRDNTPLRDDWRSAVDALVGLRAWRPQLALAMHLLETSPDPELYERATELFRLVNGEPFLDGMDYETWLDAKHK